MKFFLSVINVLVATLTLKLLWGWLVVPLGAPVIGILHALGLSVLIASVVPTASTGLLGATYGDPYLGPGQTRDQVLLDRLKISIATDLAALTVGWIVHFFL